METVLKEGFLSGFVWDMISVVGLFGAIVVIFLLLTGRVASIGKHGLVLRDDVQRFQDLDQKVRVFMSTVESFINKTDLSMTALSSNVNDLRIDKIEMRRDIDAINVKLASLTDDSRRQSKEILKTQILLTETSYERKLYLYDEYKKLGGNGWMDSYMAEQRQKNTAK